MSDPVDEAVRELAWQIRHKSALDAERLLREQLAPLLRAGQECRFAIGNYAQELARKQDGETANDDDLEAAIRRCVQSVKDYNAAFAKLTGRKP